MAPISFAHVSLDELPSSWLGSWSHVAAPSHTGSPQPHVQSTSAPRSSGCSPRGEPETLLFKARPSWWAEAWAPPAHIRRPLGFCGESVLCLRAVCVWWGWLEAPPPTPDSPRQPSSPTFKSTNPRDSAWPGTALRTEADARRSPAPLGGAGPRGRSPEADGSRSGAAPPGPGRPGGAQPQAAWPVPGTFPVIHSIGCRPRSLPGPGLKMSGDGAAETVEMGWLGRGDPWAPHMGGPPLELH